VSASAGRRSFLRGNLDGWLGWPQLAGDRTAVDVGGKVRLIGVAVLIDESPYHGIEALVS
jgi:hypothetical protein